MGRAPGRVQTVMVLFGHAFTMGGHRVLNGLQ